MSTGRPIRGRAAGYLKPIVELQKRQLLSAGRLFVDETTAKVLAPSTGKTRTGYLWVMVRDYRAHGGVDSPAIVYTYMPGRGGMWAAKLLGDYRGILQVDVQDRPSKRLMPSSSLNC